MSDSLPDIENFEASKLLSNEDVRRFVLETFSDRHLKPIKRIRYVERYNLQRDYAELAELLVKGLNITSQWTVDESTGDETIEIFQQEEYGNSSPSRMKEDIAHEIGHSVYYHLSYDSKFAYRAIWDKQRTSSTNTRAANDEEEDFCYTFAYILIDSDTPREFVSETFAFVRTIISEAGWDS